MRILTLQPPISMGENHGHRRQLQKFTYSKVQSEDCLVQTGLAAFASLNVRPCRRMEAVTGQKFLAYTDIVDLMRHLGLLSGGSHVSVRFSERSARRAGRVGMEREQWAASASFDGGNETVTASFL